MRSRWLAAVLSSIVAVGAIVVPTAAAHPGPAIPVALGMGANLSTSGDYATDVLGDPWDFSNAEDVNTAPGVGCESAPTPAQFPGIDCSVTIAGGQLGFSGAPGSILWLVRSWDLELPWGRDGENTPINAAVYPVLSLSNCPPPGFAIQFKNDAGQAGFVPFNNCQGQPNYDLRGLSAQWTGRIVSLGIYFAGGGPASFDWIRLRRPDAPAAPPGGLPVARVLTPNADGGSDYATDNGNPFDMADAGDVLDLHDIAGATFANGQLNGTIVGNDSYVELPLRTPLSARHLPPLQRRPVLRRGDELRRPLRRGDGGSASCGSAPAGCGPSRRASCRPRAATTSASTWPPTRRRRSTTRTPWPRSAGAASTSTACASTSARTTARATSR